MGTAASNDPRSLSSGELADVAEQAGKSSCVAQLIRDNTIDGRTALELVDDDVTLTELTSNRLDMKKAMAAAREWQEYCTEIDILARRSADTLEAVSDEEGTKENGDDECSDVARYSAREGGDEAELAENDGRALQGFSGAAGDLATAATTSHAAGSGLAAVRDSQGMHHKTKAEGSDGGKTAANSTSSNDENVKYSRVAEGVESADLGAQPGLRQLLMFRYSLQGLPFDNLGSTPGRHYQASPWDHANSYSNRRIWFPVLTALGPGVVWQSLDDWTPQLSTFDATYRTHTQIPLPSTGDVLAAATANTSNIFMLLIQAGSGEKDDSSRRVTVIKVGLPDGKEVHRREFNGDPGNLNITCFYDPHGHNACVASMAVLDGNLGIILARTMHRSRDGLNHQGAIAIVLDTETLALLKNHAQTSGHSFDSTLTTVGNEFIGADLGDNFPRGIHLHRFDDQEIHSKVVYSFKTNHGLKEESRAGQRYDEYTEISSDKLRVYKWSNDNNTYTELGGVVPLPCASALLVAFAGEGSATLSCLDNSAFQRGQTERPEQDCYRNAPRNLGVVIVQGSFRKDIDIDDLVISKMEGDPVHVGGFYGFTGKWAAQRVVGVRWLTDYVGDENVSRVRVVAVPGGRILILWEKWTRTYISTHAMEVDVAGCLAGEVMDLGRSVRLGRRDEALCTPEGDILLFQGDGRSLEVAVLRLAPSGSLEKQLLNAKERVEAAVAAAPLPEEEKLHASSTAFSREAKIAVATIEGSEAKHMAPPGKKRMLFKALTPELKMLLEQIADWAGHELKWVSFDGGHSIDVREVPTHIQENVFAKGGQVIFDLSEDLHLQIRSKPGDRMWSWPSCYRPDDVKRAEDLVRQRAEHLFEAAVGGPAEAARLREEAAAKREQAAQEREEAKKRKAAEEEAQAANASAKAKASASVPRRLSGAKAKARAKSPRAKVR